MSDEEEPILFRKREESTVYLDVRPPKGPQAHCRTAQLPVKVNQLRYADDGCFLSIVTQTIWSLVYCRSLISAVATSGYASVRAELKKRSLRTTGGRMFETTSKVQSKLVIWCVLASFW